MVRLVSLLLVVVLGVAGCAVPDAGPAQLGADGKPLPTVYRIRGGDTAKLQFRMVDSVNSLRSAGGLTQVQLNSQLNAAAATHSRDMSVQNRRGTLDQTEAHLSIGYVV